MGSTAVYTTDNLWGSVSEYTKCSEDFFDGGFKLLTNCKGRYLKLRRTGSTVEGGSQRFNINEIRAFSVPNLLEGAAVIEAPTPKHSDFDANNLIENIDTRSARQDFNAITYWDGISSTVTRSP